MMKPTNGITCCVLNFLKTHPQTASVLRNLRTCTNITSPISCGSSVTKFNHRTLYTCKAVTIKHSVRIQRNFSANQNLVQINEFDDTIEISKSKPADDLISDYETADLSTVAPYVIPTFNLAAYVNKSRTLQELVKLGVDLHVWEKKKGIPQFILKLDFDKDISNHLRFLHDVGVAEDQLGIFLTKNPLIFKEEIDDLHVRINYLHSKKFTPEMIARIVERNPHWLMFSTQRIDRRLGFFQQKFSLLGTEVRELTTKQPRLITYNTSHLLLATFAFKEEMGFSDEEVKGLLMKRPKLWMMNESSVLSRFNFVHNEMKIPHRLIALQPQVLGSRVFRTKERHRFLVHLDRAQYNPAMPGYVSLEKLVAGTDAEFCLNVAKSSVQSFNLFLKTL